MKIVNIIFIVIGLTFSSDLDKDKYYVGEKGVKFHIKKCEFLPKAHTEITLKKAKTKGIIACVECISKEEIVKFEKMPAIAKKAVATRCTSVSKRGLRCRKTTRNSSGRCTKHS